GQNLPQAEEAARAAQDRHNALQREQLQLQQELQLADAQRANLQRNIQQMESRRSRLLLEKDNLPGADGGALQQAQQQVAELEQERSEQVEKLAHLQEQLPLADTQRRNQRDSLQQQERMLAQTEARLHALQQLQRQIDSDKNLNAWLQQHQLDRLPHLWQSIRIE